MPTRYRNVAESVIGGSFPPSDKIGQVSRIRPVGVNANNQNLLQRGALLECVYQDLAGLCGKIV
jgi:hypothetical protein